MIARESRISLVIDRKERHFDIATDVGKISSSTNFSTSWMRSLPPAGSFLRDQRSLQALFGRSRRAVARGLDGLGRSGEARGRSAGDDRQCDGELSGAVEPEGRRRAARDDDGQGGGAKPRSTAMSGISPIRSAIATSWRRQHAGDGRGGRLCQRGHRRSRASSRPQGRTNLHALPRIAWDGRRRSLRVMRVMLSGMMFAAGRADQAMIWTETC